MYLASTVPFPLKPVGHERPLALTRIRSTQNCCVCTQRNQLRLILANLTFRSHALPAFTISGGGTGHSETYLHHDDVSGRNRISIAGDGARQSHTYAHYHHTYVQRERADADHSLYAYRGRDQRGAVYAIEEATGEVMDAAQTPFSFAGCFDSSIAGYTNDAMLRTLPERQDGQHWVQTAMIVPLLGSGAGERNSSQISTLDAVAACDEMCNTAYFTLENGGLCQCFAENLPSSSRRPHSECNPAQTNKVMVKVGQNPYSAVPAFNPAYSGSASLRAKPVDPFAGASIPFKALFTTTSTSLSTSTTSTFVNGPCTHIYKLDAMYLLSGLPVHGCRMA